MKKLISLLLITSQLAFATGETRFPKGTINAGSASIGTTSAANSKAVLDLVSTAKGFLPPRMSAAQRDAIATPPTGLIVYNTDTNQLNQYNGSIWGVVAGSGGDINYAESNPDAEGNTDGWSTYADAAGNVPADCTGGTATGLTFSRSVSSPIRDVGSFSMVQANSTSLQGKGVSFDFTIDSADQAGVIYVTLDYTASSTFIASNGTTAPLNDGTTTTNAGNSDVEWFVYDVTNGGTPKPLTPQVMTANGTLAAPFAGYFQAAPNSTSYRLCGHVATTSANATGWTYKYDNVKIGPSSKASESSEVVASVTHNVATSISSATVVPWATSVYDSAGAISGLGTASFKFTAPKAGKYQVCSSFLTASTTQAQRFEYAIYKNGVTASTVAHHTKESTNGSRQGAIGCGDISLLAGDYVDIRGSASGASTALEGSATYNWATFKRVGNAESGSDGRSLVMIATGDPASASSGNPVIWPTASSDSHSIYNASTGRSTTPSSGCYEVSVYVSGGNSITYSVYKNAVADKVIVRSDPSDGTGAGSVNICVTAGDILDVRPGGTTDNGSASWMSIKKIQGPSSISPESKVYLQYTGSAAGSVTANVTNIDWTTKVVDSHNAWNGTTFTAPRSGWYNIAGGMQRSASAQNYVSAYINGTVKSGVSGDFNGQLKTMSGGVYLRAGDLLTFRTDATSTLLNTVNHSISISSQ